jgi:hypothetical protein
MRRMKGAVRAWQQLATLSLIIDLENHTSASVIFSLPPKNGLAFFNRGSISLPTMSTNCFDSFSFSSSSAFSIANQNDPAFVNHVSTKKLMRARVRAPATVFEAGTRWDG